jgi:hypothetical protein
VEDFFGCLVHREGGGEARVSGWSGGHVGAPFLGLPTCSSAGRALPSVERYGIYAVWLRT